MNKKVLRIGIIGCGAAVEKLHLPAFNRIKNTDINAFVDKNLARARTLSKSRKKAFVTNEYQAILNKIDIALIALPNFLHAPVAIECLRHNIHVFCEKPMAINVGEGKRMLRIAKQKKLKLGIGMVRRYFLLNQKIKSLIDTHCLGRVKSFSYEEGYPFDWPLRSLYVFNKKQAGGGVLIDMGSHVIDLLNYFFGDLGVVNYKDDNHDGVEANCVLELKTGETRGKVLLSRDRTLRNTFKINFTKGSLQAPSGELTDLVIESKEDGYKNFQFRQTFGNAIYRELVDFIDSVRNNRDSLIPGEEALKTVKVIDYCYKHREEIYEPWFC